MKKIVTPRGLVKHELRVWAKGRNGKQRRFRFDSKGKAQDKLEELIKESKPDLSCDFQGRKFGDEYQYWRTNEAEPGFAPGWIVNIDTYWEQVRSHLDSLPIAELDHEVMKKIERELEAKGNARKTIRLKMGFIISVLNYAIEAKRIPYNPLGRYRMAKPEKPDIEFLDPGEAADFLRFMDEKYSRGTEARWVFAASFIALNSGLRAGELWALRPRCMKPYQSSLRITEQFNRVSKVFTELKGKESRSVPMNADVELELGSLIQTLKRGVNDLLFQRNGKPIDHDYFCEVFKRDVKEWGGRRITFHGLRHTAATLMLDAGVDMKTLQAILGHQDIRTTLEYSHLLSKNVTKAAGTFNVRPAIVKNGLKLAN